MQDEKRLVQRLQQGEPRAFEEFVDLYGARVHRLARRYVTNPTDAEDVTQEIFCDLSRSIRSFRGDSALGTWVYRVAVNHSLRHCQRKRGDNLPLDEQLLPDADWQSNPSEVAQRGELSAQIQNALHQLSPGHANVVVLCELHGLSYQECAQALNIPVGTVKSRMFTAFRRLRTLLSGYVEDAGDTPGTTSDTRHTRGKNGHEARETQSVKADFAAGRREPPSVLAPEAVQEAAR